MYVHTHIHIMQETADECLLNSDGKCIPAAFPWPDFFQLPVLMLMLITLCKSLGLSIVSAYAYANHSV